MVVPIVVISGGIDNSSSSGSSVGFLDEVVWDVDKVDGCLEVNEVKWFDESSSEVWEEDGLVVVTPREFLLKGVESFSSISFVMYVVSKVVSIDDIVCVFLVAVVDGGVDVAREVVGTVGYLSNAFILISSIPRNVYA